MGCWSVGAAGWERMLEGGVVGRWDTRGMRMLGGGAAGEEECLREGLLARRGCWRVGMLDGRGSWRGVATGEEELLEG